MTVSAYDVVVIGGGIIGAGAGQHLTAAGYKSGNVATATDQTQNTTIVGYRPNDTRDALAVAKSL